jgi:VWFA-related protein
MIVRSLCGVVALSLLPALPAAAQSEATPIAVDLVVRDKKDVPVADLRAEEVELWEGGAKRPIEGFKRVAAPTAVAGAPAAGSATAPARLAVLVFPRLQGNERDLARSAAEEFLKKQLSPGMSVAVLTVGAELVPVQNFTSDPALLKDAVKGALDPAAKSGEPDIRALYALIQWLKGQPDRKTVMLFSSGVSVPPGFDEVSQEIVGLANRYRISFYGVDTRGLDVMSGGTISRGGIRIDEQAVSNTDSRDGMGATAAAATQLYNYIIPDAHSKLGSEGQFVAPSSQDAPAAALARLAQGTGGFALERTNSFSKGMRQIAEDANGYYELTYTPAAAKSEGELRQVEVKVARDGAKVQARRQYLLGDVPAALVPVFEQRLAEALAADPPAHGLDVFDRALHYGWDGKEMSHILWVAIPLEKVSLTEVTAAAKFQGDVSVLTRVKDSSGNIATSFSQSFPLAGPLDQLSRARTQTVPLIRRVKLAPGQYTLETAVEDRTGSKIAARHTPFKVQAPQGIALSSLSLCDALPAGQGADPDDPLIFNNQRLVPNIGQPIKAGTASMTLHSVVYPAAGSKDPANIAITLLLEGQAINNASAVLPPPDAKGRIRYATAFKMDVLPPGNYRFDVAVTQGSGRAEESVPFTVTP